MCQTLNFTPTNLQASIGEPSVTSSSSNSAPHETDTARDVRTVDDDAAATKAGSSDTERQRPVVRKRRNSIVTRTLAPYRRRRGGAGSKSSTSSHGADATGLLSEDELEAIESEYSDGITAVQVVEIFTGREVRFSEASFRKYVQLGLLPRSRRVGRKGKHRGSLGMYPVKTVRRVNEIKHLMAEGYTIEEIQAQFLRFTNVLENLEEGFTELFSRLADETGSARFDNQTRRSLDRELTEAREAADELLIRLDGLSRRITAPQAEQYRSAGAAGSAEDLL